MAPHLKTQPHPTRRLDVIILAVATLLYAATAGLIALALHDRAHIDHITSDNRHPWLVNIDVSDANRNGWVGLGLVEANDERAFHDILDQGDHWTIQFSYAGHTVETQLSRAELEQNAWHITVPAELAENLSTANIPPTPQ